MRVRQITYPQIFHFFFAVHLLTIIYRERVYRPTKIEPPPQSNTEREERGELERGGEEKRKEERKGKLEEREKGRK